MNDFIERYAIPEPNSGCWLWDGGLTRKGYGRFRYKDRAFTAHRYVWRLFKGEIPEGMLVCHRCDVRCCVNLDHLFLGTDRDNVRDMIKKNRGNQGIRNLIKTHCPRGHLYDEANTYFRPNGSRRCKACNALFMRMGAR